MFLELVSAEASQPLGEGGRVFPASRGRCLTKTWAFYPSSLWGKGASAILKLRLSQFTKCTFFLMEMHCCMYIHSVCLCAQCFISQDGGRQRGEGGEQADQGRCEAWSDWYHHPIRGAEGPSHSAHAVQWLHQPEALRGTCLAHYTFSYQLISLIVQYRCPHVGKL